MNKSALFLSSFAILALSACDHYSDKMAGLDGIYIKQGASYSQTSDVSQIEPAAGTSMGGEVNTIAPDIKFSGYLRDDYIERARYEESVSDYKAAKNYTERAYMLASGQLVAPAEIEDFNVDEEKRHVLIKARADLIDALKTKNIPQNRAGLAKAQVSFDCWLDESTENKKHSQCKQNFIEAMGALSSPDVNETHYVVSFEDNKVSLSDSDRDVIGNILREYVEKEDDIQNVNLIGGNDPLSENRLSVLRSILQYNGIAADKIKQSVKVNNSVGVAPIEIIVQERISEAEPEKSALVEPASY